MELLQDAFDSLKRKGNENVTKEQLIGVGRQFRVTQLKVHKLIRETHASYLRLEQIALKPDAFTLVEYIDFLIEQETSNGNIQRVAALRASREAAEWLKEMRSQADWDPFDQPLAELKKMGLQLTFNENDCNVQILKQPNGLIKTIKKLFASR